MILALANTKGGVGKTSLAVCVAVERARAGADVLLVDADEQRTASDFVAVRTTSLGDPGLTAVALSGASVREQVLRLAPKHTETVIDVGGRDTKALRAALTVADIALIPTQPRSFDLWAIDNMADLVTEARLINPGLLAFVVLNRADPVGIGSDNREASEAMTGFDGLELLNAPIANRKAWPNATAQGLSVSEVSRPDVKARTELEDLVDMIYKRNTNASHGTSAA